MSHAQHSGQKPPPPLTDEEVFPPVLALPPGEARRSRLPNVLRRDPGRLRRDGRRAQQGSAIEQGALREGAGGGDRSRSGHSGDDRALDSADASPCTLKWLSGAQGAASHTRKGCRECQSADPPDERAAEAVPLRARL